MKNSTLAILISILLVFAFSCSQELSQDELNLASSRVQSLLQDAAILPLELPDELPELKDNLDSDKARETVAYFSSLVHTISRHLGGNTELVKAIIYTEALEKEKQFLNPFYSYLPPMNPDPVLFEPIYSSRNASHRSLKRELKNLEMGIRILSALEDSLPQADAATLATLYKNPAAKEVSAYGILVQSILDQMLYQ